MTKTQTLYLEDTNTSIEARQTNVDERVQTTRSHQSGINDILQETEAECII